MIDLHHRLVRDADPWEYACKCGSQWNFIADACTSLYPLPTPRSFERVEDEADTDYFECRKGHAHCGRH